MYHLAGWRLYPTCARDWLPLSDLRHCLRRSRPQLCHDCATGLGLSATSRDLNTANIFARKTNIFTSRRHLLAPFSRILSALALRNFRRSKWVRSGMLLLLVVVLVVLRTLMRSGEAVVVVEREASSELSLSRALDTAVLLGTAPLPLHLFRCTPPEHCRYIIVDVDKSSGGVFSVSFESSKLPFHNQRRIESTFSPTAALSSGH